MKKQIKYILVILLFPVGIFSQEICDNGIDDDGDGLIDLNDVVDCSCSPVVIPSLIPNPSFETTTCCPTSYSQVTCASGWSQATSPTSDYFNCGFNFGAATNAGLAPPPDGTGYLGTIFSPGWQEYVGSCLTSPMLAGTSYTLNFSIASTPIDGSGGICNGGVVNFSAIDITLYGLSTCAAFPINTATCPPGWTNLGSFTYNPVSSWGTISITFTPTTNINSIILGSPCTLPPSYSSPGGCYAYFYYDNLILNESNFFNSITQTGAWCDNNIQLNTPPTGGATYQWYLNNVALVGETSTALNVSTNSYGLGNYSLVTTVGAICSSVSDSVVLPIMPVATYSADTTCLNVANTFTESSTVTTGTITGWNWDFGDGNTSVLQNPTNAYTSPGNYTTTLIVTSDINCTDTIQHTVIVSPLPSTAFGPFGASGNGDGTYGFCLYNNVSFSDGSSISTGTITGWNWNFGDGNTSVLQNPSNLYAAPGTYQVELVTTSDFSCLDSITIPVVVNPPPVADFTFLNDCYYDIASFTDVTSIASGTTSSWNWDFGDGNTSTSQNPTNNYLAEGLYNVTLISTSDSGCLDTVSYGVERFPKPVANFTGTNVCLFDSSCVTDLSTVVTGTVSSWSWDFGDGSPLNTTQQPCHLYATEGTQSITLIATTNNNCTDTLNLNVEVYLLPSPMFTLLQSCINEPPTAFIDQSTIISGTVTGWNWDFGDGNTSAVQNATNIYATAGTYQVELLATSNNNCQDSITLPITVNPAPVADFTFLNECYYDVASFSDASTPGGVVIGWNWDFGDGNTSTSQNPTNNYLAEGLYNVTLISTSDSGCLDTISYGIERFPKPIANFTGTNVCLFDSSCVTDLSTVVTGTVSSWNWDFGDGSPLNTAQHPCHMYAADGTQNITLITTTNNNCTDTLNLNVEVYLLPNPMFTLLQSCINEPPTAFIDQSTIISGTVTGWNWDFGDGNTSSVQNATNIYATAGTYQVELLAISNNNCKDSITLPITVNPAPVADFTFLNECYYDVASFFDASTVPGGVITGWNWDLGDGNISAIQNPTNAYNFAGIYNVTLIVNSDSNCTDTVTYAIERYPSPVPNFSVPGVCLNVSTCVQDLSTVSSGNIVNWIWNFNDSSPLDNSFEPCHLYANDGPQSITLIVTTNNNCINDTTINTIVYPLPVAQFSSTIVCENTPPTLFQDLSTISSGSIATWSWDFGNGTSNATSPINSFLTNGVFSVQEIVISTDGCRDTLVQDVTILAMPTAGFESSALSGCIDLCVTLTDTSASNATSLLSWDWDFGNGDAATTSVANTCYTTDGIYDVSLIIENDLGCFDTATYVSYITAYPLPTADFIFSPPTTTIYNPEITFENLSSDAFIWNWDFGDNVTNSTDYSPIYTYADTGVYYVELDVWNQYNCHDSIIRVVIIADEFAMYVPNAVTPNGDGINDTFFPIGNGFVTEKFEFMIFNRWGELIYYTNAQTPWDCRHKNQIVEEGVYVWKLIVKDIKGNVRNYVGHVSVLY